LRLNVGLNAVKLELLESVTEDSSHSFFHQALARVIRERVITQIRTVKVTENDVVDTDDANQSVGLSVNDKKSAVLCGMEAF
jgi:hypothetical protein